VVVRLRDGRTVKCHALTGRIPKQLGTTKSFLAEFNAMLDQRRQRIATASS
jgi:hypothetical protein